MVNSVEEVVFSSVCLQWMGQNLGRRPGADTSQLVYMWFFHILFTSRTAFRLWWIILSRDFVINWWSNPSRPSAARTKPAIASFQTSQGTPRWQGWARCFFNFNIGKMKTFTLSSSFITILHSADLNPRFIGARRLLGALQKDRLVLWNSFGSRAFTWPMEDSLIHVETRLGLNPGPAACTCEWLKDTDVTHWKTGSFHVFI